MIEMFFVFFVFYLFLFFVCLVFLYFLYVWLLSLVYFVKFIQVLRMFLSLVFTFIYLNFTILQKSALTFAISTIKTISIFWLSVKQIFAGRFPSTLKDLVPGDWNFFAKICNIWIKKYINPFQPDVTLHIETSHLFCRVEQTNCFCMKRNIGLI